MINPNDITTVRVDQLTPDSISLTGIFPFETLDDQTLKKATFSELIAFIALQTSALQFEVKRMSVTQAYIDDNFDVTGLGINLCAGFAICNGQNGTENLDGLVGIGFGSVQNNIGGFGGEKTHVLTTNEMPTHTHNYNLSVSDNGDAGNFVITAPTNGGGTGTVTSSTSGTGAAHNNMQPYIVQLYMMKL